MRRVGILLLTAIFFFSLSFTITFFVNQHEDAGELEPVLEPVGDLVIESLRHKSQTSSEDESEKELVNSTPMVEIVEVVEFPLSSYEILEDDRGKEGLKQRYMGVLGDYVAVFKGEPGVDSVLIEETEIPIVNLPEFEIKNLRKGISFMSEEEKYSILEGLHFPR